MGICMGRTAADMAADRHRCGHSIFSSIPLEVFPSANTLEIETRHTLFLAPLHALFTAMVVQRRLER